MLPSGLGCGMFRQLGTADSIVLRSRERARLSLRAHQPPARPREGRVGLGNVRFWERTGSGGPPSSAVRCGQTT